MNKDEILALAREADSATHFPIAFIPLEKITPFLERFANLCRAPLEAEVERLTKINSDLSIAHNAHVIEGARQQEKIDALKAKLSEYESREPVAWQRVRSDGSWGDVETLKPPSRYFSAYRPLYTKVEA